MASDFDKTVENALPGWKVQRDIGADSAKSNWPETADQSGVDFEELRRAYLPSSDKFDADEPGSPTNPPSGLVSLTRVSPKAKVDSSFGEKTVVFDRNGRGVVGVQG